jgi:hypothetical protein
MRVSQGHPATWKRHHVYWRLVGAFVVTIAPWPSALAQPSDAAPAPDPTVGDIWVYRKVDLFTNLETGRFSLEFVRKDPSSLSYKAINLKTGASRDVSRTRELGVCNISKDIKERSCGSVFSFPLRVGQRQGYEHLPIQNGHGYSTLACTVAAREMLSVTAGSFDTFRVECVGRWTSNGGELDAMASGGIHDTHWYAPALNAEVKNIHRSYGHRAELFRHDQTELLSFKRADRPQDETDQANGRASAGPISSNPATAASGQASSPVVPSEFIVGTTKFTGTFFAGPGSKSYSGTGRVAWANGDVYDGTLINGSREGQGSFVWAKGQRYDGNWRDDRPQGQGKLVFVNGDAYEGGIEAGVPNGSGKMAYASGDLYVGAFKGGMPDGDGSYAWKSGDTYVGQWKNGLKEGRGVITWANGARWEGTFVDDQRANGKMVRSAE